MIAQITVDALRRWLEDEEKPQPLLLDVREPYECQQLPFPGAVNIPMALIPLRYQELASDRPVVAVCLSGARSAQVTYFLQRQGLEAYNLAGGVMAWQQSAARLSG